MYTITFNADGIALTYNVCFALNFRKKTYRTDLSNRFIIKDKHMGMEYEYFKYFNLPDDS